jgi:uncharacterized protein
VLPEPVTADPPPPPALAPLAVGFTEVVFVHWAYEPGQLRPFLPTGLALDTMDGTAYVGLVAGRMHCCGTFLELNVRTYSVDGDGRRGVVFLTMEADRWPWVLAGRAAGLPYSWSRMARERTRPDRAGDGDVLRYRGHRRRSPVGVEVCVRVGDPVEGGPLDHFLTARWRLHAAIRGVIVTARFDHPRWPLHAAELVHLHDELLAATGLPAPAGAPASVRYSPGTRGRFGLPTPA